LSIVSQPIRLTRSFPLQPSYQVLRVLRRLTLTSKLTAAEKCWTSDHSSGHNVFAARHEIKARFLWIHSASDPVLWWMITPSLKGICSSPPCDATLDVVSRPHMLNKLQRAEGFIRNRPWISPAGNDGLRAQHPRRLS
jgi:hypothetical protein